MPSKKQRALRLDNARAAGFRTRLLDWAARNGRSFVWRTGTLKPFEILLTEILLAKSRAEVVEPIAKKMHEQFASPAVLARADVRKLERLVFPLGLHRKRSRHLKACAKALVDQHQGEIPITIEELMELPFVGRYAANAIANVAFGQHVPVVDANVSRVYQRVFSLPDPPERLAAAHALWDFAARMLPEQRSKEFNWALLDLGGTICSAKTPLCGKCPVSSICDQNRALRPSQRRRRSLDVIRT